MESLTNSQEHYDMLSFEAFRKAILEDYKTAVISREVSLLGRREVLTGKAKFGIFGDGKEVAQIAMAKFFKPGDFRSGYYRDQTFMFAAGLATVEQYFSQLYGDTDPQNDPFSSGRQMNAHFATRFVEENGEWVDLANRKNITADMAPTASQMPRALGLAYASKCFRASKHKEALQSLSNNGNEICFCTIGDASTSEGHFWEAMNAAGVLQVPLAVFVWDDGYGISVPKSLQTTKGSISEALRGLEKLDDTNGIRIYKLKAWDYAGMCQVIEHALQQMRETHVPALFHVEEVTQPQGHSTSGSHERYKSPERLAWEREWDCIKKMREWMLENGLAEEDEIAAAEQYAKAHVKESRQIAWDKYITPLRVKQTQAVEILREMVVNDIERYNQIQELATDLSNIKEPLRRDILRALFRGAEIAPDSPSVSSVRNFYQQYLAENKATYNSHLYDESPKSPLLVKEVKPLISPDSPTINGYEVLNKYFDELFTHNNKVYAFGEDVGQIGDVNQGFAGLQEKHGVDRITDTGIRELSIMGQALGMSLRGLRPIAEIQYLDYLLYGLQVLSDDVASTYFRTRGLHSCPLIIRTRGHRLEGIWHSGSPMGMIINSLRGLHVCVPRNMVQAVGLYNTLLQGNDPALVIECLNGYRLKEKLPANLLTFTVPLGVPEVIKQGDDLTIVSYGSTLRIIQDAVDRLTNEGISCEVIDVQTLLPFDVNHLIIESLKKTNRILFVDEDVPGGAAAYMYNQVIEGQNAFKWLDVSPRTLTAQAHRPSYGSDGDYFSKPNAEDVIKVVREMMNE